MRLPDIPNSSFDFIDLLNLVSMTACVIAELAPRVATGCIAFNIALITFTLVMQGERLSTKQHLLYNKIK